MGSNAVVDLDMTQHDDEVNWLPIETQFPPFREILSV